MREGGSGGSEIKQRVRGHHIKLSLAVGICLHDADKGRE